MNRFIKDMRRFWEYAMYSAGTILRSEVAYSYLNWLWWVLDPILMMMVYTFISKYIFVSRPGDYPVFVMIGLAVWNYFNKGIMSSVNLISSNKSLINKVYVPKFVLVIIRMQVAFVKMSITMLIVIVMMLVMGMPITWRIVHLIPCQMVLSIFTFACCNLCMHIGVFIHDMANVTTVLLKVVMYLSGVFYSILDVMPEPMGFLLSKCNPIAFFIISIRGVLQYGKAPNYHWMGIWLLVSLAGSVFSVWLIYRYENTYVRVI